jgi:hypothetical protein
LLALLVFSPRYAVPNKRKKIWTKQKQWFTVTKNPINQKKMFSATRRYRRQQKRIEESLTIHIC